MRARVVACLLAGASGCGLGLIEDEPGGANNLPTLGAGPYAKLPLDLETPADEPYILEDRTADLTDPSALERQDGGLRVWYTREEPEQGAEIWYAELPAVTALPDVAPRAALSADQDWEEGRVAAPSVLDLGGGLLYLYYEGGIETRSIGLARSTDGGGHFEKDPKNPILEGAGRPSAGLGAGRTFLYVEEGAGSGGAILEAESADGVSFDAPRQVLEPGFAGEFDELGVFDPYAVIQETPAGRLHFGLFYAGRAPPGDSLGGEGEPLSAIGYAGSFDGRRFEKLDGGAVLAPAPPGERGPAALLEPASGLLLFSEPRSGHQRIAVAVHP